MSDNGLDATSRSQEHEVGLLLAESTGDSGAQVADAMAEVRRDEEDHVNDITPAKSNERQQSDLVTEGSLHHEDSGTPSSSGAQSQPGSANKKKKGYLPPSLKRIFKKNKDGSPVAREPTDPVAASFVDLSTTKRNMSNRSVHSFALNEQTGEMVEVGNSSVASSGAFHSTSPLTRERGSGRRSIGGRGSGSSGSKMHLNSPRGTSEKYNSPRSPRRSSGDHLTVVPSDGSITNVESMVIDYGESGDAGSGAGNDKQNRTGGVGYSDHGEGGDGSGSGGDDIRDAVKKLLVSLNFFQAYISKVSRAFCWITMVIAIVTIALCGTIVAVTYLDERKWQVEDHSICRGSLFTVIKTNTLAYNCALLMTTSFFLMWFSARAVNLEREGLLYIYVFVGLTHIGRASYFLFSGIMRTYALPPTLRLCAEVILPITLVCVVGTFPLAYRVNFTFGWRIYAKGVTIVAEIERMKRHKQFDTALKLDTFISANTFISIFFLVSNLTARIYGGVVTVITLLFLQLISRAMKKGMVWVVYAFFFVCALLPVFYIYTVVVLLLEDDEHCTTRELLPCLTAANVSVAYTPFRMNLTDPLIAIRSENHVSFFEAQMCVPTELNATALEDCLFQAEAGPIHDCCAEYGRCNVKQLFRDRDRPLTLALGIGGLLCRLLTVVIAVRQARALALPSVREMFERGERNLREFKLPTFNFGDDDKRKSGRRRKSTTTKPPPPGASDSEDSNTSALPVVDHGTI